MKEYESILAKARKLAALADRDNGASEGERKNAEAALSAHLEKFGITLEALNAGERRERSVICKSRFNDQKPKRDKELAQLCAQILRYVADDPKRPMRLEKTEVELPARGLAVKLAPCYQITAPVTDLEYEDWKECFEHFAPAFIDTMRELRQTASQAAAARKHGLSGFVHKHELFPESAECAPSKKSRPSAGLIAALLAAKGSAWAKRHALTDKPLIP